MEKESIKERHFQSGDLYQSNTKELLIKHAERKEYRSLETAIKKRAKWRGYKTKFGEPIPGSSRFIDILLERKGKKIACKIFVTGEEKVGDIKNYINAGFETIVACAKDLKILEKIQIRIKTQLKDEIQNKVLTFEPDGLFLYIDQQLVNEASTETIIKGYRVKVNYIAVPEGEAKAKQNNILKVIVDSARRREANRLTKK